MGLDRKTSARFRFRGDDFPQEIRFRGFRRFFFFIRIHVPPHVRSGLQIFCETKFKIGGKKNKKQKKRSKIVFPAKMGLNSGEPSTHTAHALPCLHTQ